MASAYWREKKLTLDYIRRESKNEFYWIQRADQQLPREIFLIP